MRFVTPHPKPSGRRPQHQRRLDFEREFRAAKKVVRARSGGRCEVRGCPRPAAHTHHKKGRIGPDVNLPEHLLDVCVECDHLITTEPAWAIQEGYSQLRF